MRIKTLWAIVFVLSAFLFAACRTSAPPGPTTPPSGASPDTRPCVANITVEGSRMSGRTFRTFQDFSDVTRAAAFDQIVQSLATSGWTIASSSKETGVITSWAQPSYSKGQTESLNVVVRDKGAAGIRVEVTYIAPAMASVSQGTLHNAFCKIMEDVGSAQKKSTGEPQPKPAKGLSEEDKGSKPVTSQPEPKPSPPALSSSPKQQTTPEGDLRKAVVMAPSENLRNAPRGNIIGKVKKGTSLAILEDQDKWLRVRLENGTEAWIWKASTSEAPKPAPTAK